MSYPQTAAATLLPIPVQGLNTHDSPLAMPETFSPWLQNVDVDGQKISVRKGFDLYGTIATNNTVISLGVHGDPTQPTAKLFAYCASGGNNTVLLGNGDGSFAIALTTASGASSEAEVMNYKNNLAFNVPSNVSEESARTADGTTWSNIGFTSGGNHIAARCATEYKGRVYLSNGSTVYYSALGAVTGACSSVDFSDFFRYTMFPGFLATLSSPGERPSETYLAIGSAAGEVLVYSGDYPGSASWAMVGRYKIPPVAGQKCAIEINNDVWIMTLGGIVSLRALMNAGEDALKEASPTYYIQQYWNALMAAVPSMYSGYSNVSAAYWPEKNKVYVFVPVWVSRLTPLAYDYIDTKAGTILVYDVASRAWSIHQVPTKIFTMTADASNTTHGSITYFKNNVYFHIGKNIYRYGSNYMDDADPTRGGSNAYQYFIGSAYSTFGDASRRKRIIGWAPLLKQDHSSGSIEIYTSIDISRSETQPSAPALIDGINAINVNNGGYGTIFQWTLRGTTNASISGPIELYSMGVIK